MAKLLDWARGGEARLLDAGWGCRRSNCIVLACGAKNNEIGPASDGRKRPVRASCRAGKDRVADPGRVRPGSGTGDQPRAACPGPAPCNFLRTHALDAGDNQAKMAARS